MCIRDRAFGVVLAIGFLLLVSLALGAVLSAVIAWLGARVPVLAAGLGVLNVGLALGLTSVLFALLFKVLPDVSLGYRTVAAGGVMTAVLFTVGRTLIGLYIGQSGTASSYGAVGSVAVGAVLALLPGVGARSLGPVQTFSVAAALTVVLVHLIPESADSIGMWALVGFAVGLVAPLFIAGKAEFGVISQSAMAFSHLVAAFSVIISGRPG